jgi:DNA invertase Pin-like site-specific DNA recombinase
VSKTERKSGWKGGIIRRGRTTGGEQRRRAAMYVRMSTDHQKYSTENQADAIRDYAAHRQMDIVKTYADSGKSGLSLDGRDALQNLIADVQSGVPIIASFSFLT